LGLFALEHVQAGRDGTGQSDAVAVGPSMGAVGKGDLDLVGVAVGVDTNDGVDEFYQQGHRPGPFR
jgi:hypothetical protein